jgi:hypothetical protein
VRLHRATFLVHALEALLSRFNGRRVAEAGLTPSEELAGRVVELFLHGTGAEQ